MAKRKNKGDATTRGLVKYVIMLVGGFALTMTAVTFFERQAQHQQANRTITREVPATAAAAASKQPGRHMIRVVSRADFSDAAEEL